MRTLKVVFAAAIIGSFVTLCTAQGPSSRRSISSGRSVVRSQPMLYDDGSVRYTDVEVAEEIPVPDLFRMEAPFVERNLRMDYLATNNLEGDPLDESRFFAELSYSFSERFGLVFAAPYLIRDDEFGPDPSGFGDLEIGARFVALGSESEDAFRVALGLNVLIPTGDESRGLGEGVSVIEPEILLFQMLADSTFAQAQLSLGIPTGGVGKSNELGYSFGIGHVLRDLSTPEWFKYPTLTLELNGGSLVGGIGAGETVIDITPGLRWSITKWGFGGIACSAPLTDTLEFDYQLIVSFIYRYGVDAEDPTGAVANSSRPTF